MYKSIKANLFNFFIGIHGPLVVSCIVLFTFIGVSISNTAWFPLVCFWIALAIGDTERPGAIFFKIIGLRHLNFISIFMDKYTISRFKDDKLYSLHKKVASDEYCFVAPSSFPSVGHFLNSDWRLVLYENFDEVKRDVKEYMKHDFLINKTSVDGVEFYSLHQKV
jgi:hypothetical protein